jgi:hypothetical protein
MKNKKFNKYTNKITKEFNENRDKKTSKLKRVIEVVKIARGGKWLLLKDRIINLNITKLRVG